MDLREAATDFIEMGYSVIPVNQDKTPNVHWSPFRKQAMDEVEINSNFKNTEGIAIICGEVSGNLLCLDFDDKASAFDEWLRLANGCFPGGIDFILQETQNGGKHVFIKSDTPISGNQKLAMRNNTVLIETRGEGGYVLVDPTAGYKVIHGFWDETGYYTQEGIDILLDCARQLDETTVSKTYEEPFPVPEQGTSNKTISTLRPGDDYNQRGQSHLADTLLTAGWGITKDGFDGNQRWTRPGKSGNAVSATLKDGCFYVFSTSTDFSTGAHSLFDTYAILKHSGSHSAAAVQLRAMGYGDATWGLDDGIQKVTESNIVSAPIKDIDDMLSDADIGMREELIPGYLRRGEVMNLVAAPKTGKSWLVMQLGIAAANAGNWLGITFQKPLNVLIIDNELHSETFVCRLRSVLKSMKHDLSNVHCKFLRGQGVDINNLEAELIEGDWDLIILDAWYRFIPKGSSENDNSDIVQMYNKLDTICDHIGAGMIVVHHTSKGNQSDRKTTDIGSGAGSQSRACDTHCVLIPCEEDEDMVVMSAVTRSFECPKEKYLQRHKYIWKEVKPPIASSSMWTVDKLVHYINTHDGKIGKAQLSMDLLEGPNGITSTSFKRLLDLALEQKNIQLKNGVYHTQVVNEPVVQRYNT